MKKTINQKKGERIMKQKMKSTYKNSFAKKLQEKACNDLGPNHMDFDSFRFAAALIEAGEYKGLYKIMYEMDSIPREYIFHYLSKDQKIEYHVTYEEAA